MRHLKRAFPVSTTGIAAIFFKRSAAEIEGTVRAVLESVQGQLAPITLATGARALSTHPSLDDVREALFECLSKDRRAFLVIDDFDLCSLEVAAAVEEELTKLQDRGLSIFVTSRLPREVMLNVGHCDAVPEDSPWHAYENLNMWWVCATCRNNERPEEDNNVCNDHVKEYVCDTWYERSA